MIIPAASVVLPFRNAERFLPAALESIQGQDFRDFELIAVDDGSDDGSAALVRTAASRDSRVRLIASRRRGLPAALNEGCRLARGAYLVRMDADDIALPSRLSRQVAALDADPGLVVVGGAIDLIDENDRPVGETRYAVGDADIRAVLAHAVSPFCHSATAIRRSAFEAVGGYRESCELAEDLDLWLRLAKAGHLANLDTKVLRYRLHPLSASFDRIATQIASHYRALILNDMSRSDVERARALDASDPWTLVEAWAGPLDAPGRLARSTSWYVEWAVIGGYDERVDELIDTISRLAPRTHRRSIEWALWQSATMAALGTGRHDIAERHLDRGRIALARDGSMDDAREALDALRWAIRARLEATLSAGPLPAPRDGGYLDSVQWLDGGRRVVVAGWIARPGGEPEVAIGLHMARTEAASIAVSRVHRPDVASVMGDRYVASGFKVDVRFDTAVAPAEAAVRASVRYQDGRLAALEDANVRVQWPLSER